MFSTSAANAGGSAPAPLSGALRLAGLYGVLLLLCLGVAWLSLGVGALDLSDGRFRSTLLALRATRLVAGFVAGAALAVAGLAVQGLFRNPLASPSVLGTTSGAMFGGQAALLLVGWFGVLGGGVVSTDSQQVELIAPEMVVPLGCLAGAVVSLAVLLVFLHFTEDLLALLLTGFVLSALFVSMGGFLISSAQQSWELGRAILSFSLGSVSGIGERQIAFSLPLVVGGAIAVWGWGPTLDSLLSGEEEARSLGVDVRAARWWTAIWVSVLVAGAVSLAGNLSFVGLIVPHALRPFFGMKHRPLVLAVALAGGAFVVLCDVLGRLLPVQSEMPLGVITGMLGAPLFLLLLWRSRRGGLADA